MYSLDNENNFLFCFIKCIVFTETNARRLNAATIGMCHIITSFNMTTNHRLSILGKNAILDFVRCTIMVCT